MEKEKAKYLKEQAQQSEKNMGLREFGNCPICDDMIYDDDGIKKCVYCGWNTTWTPEKTAEVYNEYWGKGRVKKGYEREPKTPDDFKSNCCIHCSNKTSLREEIATKLNRIITKGAPSEQENSLKYGAEIWDKIHKLIRELLTSQ